MSNRSMSSLWISGGSKIPGWRRSIVVLVLFAALALSHAPGCSSGRTFLTLTSLRDRQTYSQPLSKGYASYNANGDLDVVLRGADRAGRVREGKETGAGGDQASALQQVIHIRVLWQPGRGTRADVPAMANAAFHWYVMGGPGQGVIEYTGTGFVSVARNGNTARLNIRNATLKPTTRRGDLADPLGPTRLRGTVIARMDQRQVNEALAVARASLSDPSPAASAVRTARADD